MDVKVARLLDGQCDLGAWEQGVLREQLDPRRSKVIEEEAGRDNVRKLGKPIGDSHYPGHPLHLKMERILLSLTACNAQRSQVGSESMIW
jgi:hypothetical protein